MYNLKAKMFNRKAAGPKSRSGQVIRSLSLKEGQQVADVGIGGGYFSLRFAEIVGDKGKVFGIDSDSKFLEYLESNSKKQGYSNIVTILAEGKGFPLSSEELDLVFLRNVCHHIPDRVAYFREVATCLKPDGRVAIIDYGGKGSWSFHRIFGHYVDKEGIRSEMSEAGYHLSEEYDFLPEQSFQVFRLSD
ncbi:MAG: class I SAM-dependent methyltransferase [Halobacteriota archaeon]